MQLLQRTELLQLAKCCRFTLACASSPFAWRHVEPLSVAAQEGSDNAQLLAVQKSTLLCHISLVV